VHEVGAVVGAALEAEPGRPLGQRQGGGREVSEVGLFEGETGRSLAEAVDGPERRAIAVEAGDTPGAGQVAAGDGGLGARWRRASKKLSRKALSASAPGIRGVRLHFSSGRRIG
jgi:hypothetical protein